MIREASQRFRKVIVRLRRALNSKSLIFAWLVAAQSVTAQTAIEGELRQSSAVEESRNPVALIATGNVLGLMTEGALIASGPGFSQNNTISFHVAIDAPADALCIRLKSRDEDYRGAVDFEAASANQGWHRIMFATDHAEYLSTLDGDELLVGAFVGRDCSELYPETASLVPVSLSNGDDGPLFLLANTRNNDAVVVSILDDGSEIVRDCEALSGEMSQSVFQRKCPIDRADAARVIVEANDGFGELLWRETVTIVWPGKAR